MGLFFRLSTVFSLWRYLRLSRYVVIKHQKIGSFGAQRKPGGPKFWRTIFTSDQRPNMRLSVKPFIGRRYWAPRLMGEKPRIPDMHFQVWPMHFRICGKVQLTRVQRPRYEHADNDCDSWSKCSLSSPPFIDQSSPNFENVDRILRMVIKEFSICLQLVLFRRHWRFYASYNYRN